MFGEAFIKHYENSNEYFKTGFDELDKCIGKVTTGSIITIGARPAMGKTSFAISVCNHLLDMDKKILFCETESSQPTAEKQFVHIKSKISHDIYTSEEWDKIGEILKYYNDKQLSLFCKPNMTTDEIEEKIKEEKPEIVFVNSVQCIKLSKAPNITEALNVAVKELKRIAVENDLIVVLTSQLSRGTECRMDNRPLLSDLRNSSSLEDLSDVVLMIYRPEYYDCSDKDLKNKAEIIIRKNKFGPTDTVNLKFNNGIFSKFATEDYIKAVFS